MLERDLERRIELFHVFDQGVQSGDRLFAGGLDVAQQPLLLEQEVLDLLVDFSVVADVALVVDLPEGDVQQVDHTDQDLLQAQMQALEPGLRQQVSADPDEGFPVLAIARGELIQQGRQDLLLVFTDELVDYELAVVAQKQTGIQGRPLPVMNLQLHEEALFQIVVRDTGEQGLDVVDLSQQIREGILQSRVQVRIHIHDFLNQQVAADHLLGNRGVGFGKTHEVGEHLGKEIRIRFLVLQELPDRSHAIKEALLGFEVVEDPFLETDRLVSHGPAVELVRDVSEYRVGLEELSGIGAPLRPLGGRQHLRDQLLLDRLHVRLIVEAADHGSKRPDRILFDLVAKLFFGHGVSENPDVLGSQDLQCADRHLEAHLVPGLRGEVDHDPVVANVRDPADLPTRMMHVVAHVEGDVLFEVGDGVMNVPPALIEVGDPQVLIQLAVPLVLLPETLDDLLAGLGVLGLVGEHALEELDGGIPLLVVPEMGDQRTQELGRPFAAQDLDDLALDREEELDVFGCILDDLLPYVLHAGKQLLVDEPVKRLLVVLQSAFDLPVCFFLLRQEPDDFGFLVVDLDVPFPDLELLVLLVRVLVDPGEGLQGELVLPVFQDAVAQVLHDVPLVVVHEDADQRDQVGLVDQLLALGDDAGEIQSDDAVAGMTQMFFAQLQDRVLLVGLPRFPDDFVELNEIVDAVAVERRAGPLFLVQQLTDLLCQSFLQFSYSCQGFPEINSRTHETRPDPAPGFCPGSRRSWLAPPQR